MSYLLDTNILIWHALDSSRLSAKHRALLMRTDIVFWVSIVSLWEITIKATR